MAFQTRPKKTGGNVTRNQRPSRSRRAAEPAKAVLRMGYSIDATGPELYPFLEFTLLANAPALRELSALFADAAVQAERPTDDPDYHEHLGSWMPPFDRRLSDRIEIRIEALPPGNKRKVYERMGGSLGTVKKGSMIPHLKKLAADARREIRRDAEWFRPTKRAGKKPG